MMKRKNNRNSISDINITPFVDIVLVLLLVFMIVTPYIFNNIQINLPEVSNSNDPNTEGDQKEISIVSLSEIYLGNAKMGLADLKQILQADKSISKTTFYIKANKDLSYDSLAKVLSTVKSAGVQKLSLVTKLDKVHE